MKSNGEWQEVLLGDIATEVTVGFVGPMTGEYVPNGIAFLRSQNIEPYHLNLDGLIYINEAFHKKLKKSALKPGDVVVVRTGTPGTAAVIPETLLEANCSDLVIIRPGDHLDPRFLAYYINAVAHYQVSANLVGAVQQHFNVGAAKNLKMALPPIKEQQAISQIIGHLNEKIGLNHRMNHTLEEIAEAIFKSWFVDFDPVVAKVEGRQPFGMGENVASLFPSSFADTRIGPIPSSWLVDKVSAVCELAYGKSLIADKRIPGKVAVFGSDGQIGWHDSPLVKGPGIVIGRKGNAGKVNWAPIDFYPIDTTFYVVQKNESIPLLYLYFYLLSLDLPFISGDSAVPGLNREAAYSQDILIPASDVLLMFDQITSPIRKKVDENLQEIGILSSIRTLLLPELLNGNIRLHQVDRLMQKLEEESKR
jgi:type I restriction enzyme, S subunit